MKSLIKKLILLIDIHPKKALLIFCTAFIPFAILAMVFDWGFVWQLLIFIPAGVTTFIWVLIIIVLLFSCLETLWCSIVEWAKK